MTSVLYISNQRPLKGRQEVFRAMELGDGKGLESLTTHAETGEARGAICRRHLEESQKTVILMLLPGVRRTQRIQSMDDRPKLYSELRDGRRKERMR